MNATDPVTKAIKKIKRRALWQKVIGAIFMFYGGLYTIVGLAVFDEVLDAVLILFFAAMAALGVWLISKGMRKTKLIKLIPDYSARLASDPEGSIDRLAASSGTSVDKAAQNIRDMLAFGFFPKYFLDVQHNRVVMPGASTTRSQAGSAHAADTPRQTVQYTTVQCSGCGAVNKIAAGSIGECEYCGSQVSG